MLHLDTIWIYIALIFTTFLNVIAPLPGSQAIALIAILTDPHKAVALASFYFLLSAIIRMIAFRKKIHWRLVKPLALFSAPGAILGSLALFPIPDSILLFIVIIFSIYFLYQKIAFAYPQISIQHTFTKNAFTNHTIGFFSGFLQGTGLAGSDLRNNYLYSQNLNLSEVQGTTAVLGALNFALATAIRILLNRITIPDVSPLLFLLPFMIFGVWIGRHILNKIDKKYGDWIIILVMGTTILFLIYKAF